MDFRESVQLGASKLDNASAAIITAITTGVFSAGPQALLAVPELGAGATFFQKAFDYVTPEMSSELQASVAHLRDDANARVEELTIAAVVPWPIVYAPLGAISGAVQRMCLIAHSVVSLLSQEVGVQNKEMVSKFKDINSSLVSNKTSSGIELMNKNIDFSENHIYDLEKKYSTLYLDLIDNPTKFANEIKKIVSVDRKRIFIVSSDS